MNLKSIENEANLVNDPTASDIDAASRLGPIINKNLISLEALCRLIPNCSTELDKIRELRELLSKKINLQLNVLEAPTAVEQRVQHHSQKSVGQLEDKLKDMAKGTAKIDYDSIDQEMQEISKNNSVTPDDLHKLFAASHGGMTPDDYAKAIRDRSINEEIYEFYFEHNEHMGNAVWPAVSTHLKSKGYDNDLIVESVNKAITILIL